MDVHLMGSDRYDIIEEVVRGVPMRVYRNRHRSLGELFDASATRYGDRTHLVYGEQRITFEGLAGRVEAIAGGLAECGVRRGDRVAVLAANHPAWAETLWASTRLGAVVVGLNGWWTADELAHAIHDSEPTILVADRRRLERIAPVLEAGTSVRRVFVIGGDDPEPLLAESDSVEPFTALHGCAPLEKCGPLDEDDPAVILYTSGTTGRSKGAVWTHRSILAALQSHAHRLAQSKTPADARSNQPAVPQLSLLLCVPMFHTSGLHSGLITALATGAKAVILEGRFRPEKALRLIQDEQVVAWGAVPTMVHQVLDCPDRERYDIRSLRAISYGGAPASRDLQRRAREAFGLGVKLGNAYGLTETTAAIATISGAEFADRPDSVGRPNPLVEVRIVDESGTDLPIGQRGEVLIKGPFVMAGYWRHPDATAAAIRDGWFHTGDVGEVDADGYLYIRDRSKDMIIRGGENVYCAEIEDRLEQHPAIVEAAVVGVPHPVLGEEVKAVVRTATNAGLTAADVQAWAAAALAPFKVPATVEFVTDPLPRNPAGKLLKQGLR